MALWPCKLGPDSLNPGASSHSAPRGLSGIPPRYSPVGGGGTSLSPVIDSDGNIWVQNLAWRDGCLVKCDQAGVMLLRLEVRPVCTPVILDGVLYTADIGGTAYAVPTHLSRPHNYVPWEGLWRWKSKFCASCGGDPWAAAAVTGSLVLAGKVTDNPLVQWNDHVFVLDTADGSERWRYSLRQVLMLFSPSIVGASLVFADMSSNVHCLALADGAPRWKHKGGKATCRSTGGAVATSDGWVLQAGNQGLKKEPNAPFGGKGFVRAFDLEDGSLKWEVLLDYEANSTPSVFPCGPGGSRLVVVPLGANPGNKDQNLGYYWPMSFVAFELSTGKEVWDTKKTHGAVEHFGETCLQDAGMNASPTACSTAVCGADGTIFVGLCNGWIVVVNGVDGTVAGGYRLFCCAIQATPAIGPNILVVASMRRVLIFADPFHPDTPPGIVYQPLERSFGDSGVDHFWPNKSCQPEHTCKSTYVGPTDVTKPAWSFEALDRQLGDFFYNSAVIDSQRNIYVSTNHRDLYCIRPDGSLRGRINLGSAVRTPSLVGRTGYVACQDGFAISFDLETLRYNWAQRYCFYVNLDSWSCMADDKGNLIIVGSELAYADGAHEVFNLSTEDGHTKWRFDASNHKSGGDFQGTVYNSMPAVVDDTVLTCTNFGVIYCLKLEDGSLVWKFDDVDHVFNTGHINVGPNGLVYGVSHVASDHKFNACCSGGHGVVQAFDVRTGAKRWRRDFELETEVTSVVIPKRGGEGNILVVPLGNNCGAVGVFGAMGNLWRGEMVGLDAETGERLWSMECPPLKCNSFPGNSENDVFLPDSWGSLSADANGTVYGGFENGFFYAVDGQTGEKLSEYDMKNTCNCAPAIAPGMVVVMSAYRVYCWRDETVEANWIAQEEASDPRAFEVPAPASPPAAALRGVLLGPRRGAFDDKDLRPFDWAAEFISREKDRQHLLDNVLTEEDIWQKKLDMKFHEHRKKYTGNFWIVTGGSKEGGIKVREGVDLKSKEVERRLPTGSVVEEIELQADRLNFARLFGKEINGNIDDFRFQGWVSISLKGKKLLDRL